MHHAKLKIFYLNEALYPEWSMIPVITNNTKATYLNIWKITFMNEDVLKECKNSLMISQLLLINPFSYGQLERMFSCINALKQNG